ncbi:potassium efflux system protein [Azomonas agilis]|uniref:Potassium efflux system protein n=1 Tax=Azomonas agilis TaxID=116849 RepID=A0A562IYY6_9GAMM|nr:mechanosensitive channel MscK [Azomonas agilis]TWH76063.1 potassium efflux system protein [Azomonas agilis]
MSLRTLLLASLLSIVPVSLPGVWVATAATNAAAPASESSSADKAADPIQTFNALAASRQQSLADLKRLLPTIPQQIREAQRKLEQLKSTPPQDPTKAFANLPLANLEQRLAQRAEELADWQKSLTEANSALISAQTRPERAQAEITTSQARVLEIETIISSGREEGKALTTERTAVLNAELAALKASIEFRRQELAANTQLLDLSKNQRELLVEQIARAEQESLALQALINDQRREQSEQTVAKLSQEAASTLGVDQVLVKERATNLRLSNQLLKFTERLNEVTRLNLTTRQQLDVLNQADRSLVEQIAVLNGSPLLARILYQQEQALPQVALDKNLADEIGDTRLYQFELGQQRERLNAPDAYAEQLLAKQPPESVTSELKTTLLDVLKNREELIKRLEPTVNTLLNESISLQLHQRQMQEIARSVRNTIDEQMFWIPSNKPLSLAWFQTFPDHFSQQVESMPWISVLEQWRDGLLKQPLFFSPLLLLIALMVWKRRVVNNRLEVLGRSIGHYTKDSQLHTPFALLLNLLLALPGSLGLALCGYLLQMDGRGQNEGLGAAFYQLAQAWLVFYTAHQVLAPKGMAEQHFLWPAAQVNFLRRELRRLGAVVALLVSVVAFATHQPASLSEDVIGLVVVLVCYLLMTLGLIRLLFKNPERDNLNPWRQTLGLLFSFLPLALIFVVGLGYYYTALRLTGRLIDTLYLVMIWVLLEATLVRGLSVAARRLAYQRVLAKRKAMAEEGTNSDALELEDTGRNIEQINQQSLRLLRLSLFGLFFVALYWVWADLISVVSYLDNFTLYEFGAGATATAISLRDFLAALLMAGITLALARNLPGLLEVLVLSRLKLAQGSAYATSTLLSYALTGIGISVTLSTLGVSWDKLQWLVAALSVGLGFGLQEIFANFVSGLIILFERPVRIGDVVTIGTLSGRVSRIRIRATTITDFDRKEIIVPNKTFITSQLINWTLSDTVTRVTIKVGVAFGSNLDLVRKIMMQVALDNPRVLREPGPEVYFLNFGESTLDHELRIHVRELGDRTPATDEINRKIDQEFSKHGISIAFRRVDITLRNRDGDEVTFGVPSGSEA